MDLKEIGWKGMEVIDLRIGKSGRAVDKRVMRFGAP
jgi:hypothetical protein